MIFTRGILNERTFRRQKRAAKFFRKFDFAELTKQSGYATSPKHESKHHGCGGTCVACQVVAQ